MPAALTQSERVWASRIWSTARMSVLPHLYPALQEIEQFARRRQPQTGIGGVHLGTHQYAKIGIGKCPECIFVGHVVAQVGQLRIRHLGTDYPDHVTLVAPRHAHFDSAVEMVQLEDGV